MAAALLMANLQANLQSQCATGASRPTQFLQSVNQLFLERLSIDYVDTDKANPYR